MMSAQQLQPPPPPLFESAEVRVLHNRVQTKAGSYDARAIDGVEFAPVTMPAARMLRDLAGAVAWAAFLVVLAGVVNAPLFLAGAVLGVYVRWWLAERKHAVVILVRGARVQLFVGDEAAVKQIATAVLQVAGESR